jgi:hypothetical protein
MFGGDTAPNSGHINMTTKLWRTLIVAARFSEALQADEEVVPVQALSTWARSTEVSDR